jgi:hypothetical protein
LYVDRDGHFTLSEIMHAMGWQKHTVRGFMAGAMKKAGYTAESFKPEGGEPIATRAARDTERTRPCVPSVLEPIED